MAGIKLEKIFGKGFLQPLEETDNFFHLEIEHLDLKKYSLMIANSELRDDLDLAATVYDPEVDSVAIKMPEIDTAAFYPLLDKRNLRNYETY